ncbi:MAG: hypothetical protein QOI82_2425 [Actinomycetota bacterium]|nr:hypothetical protein [Actinomycetota bacterium]
MSAFRGSASGLSKQRLRARRYVHLSRDLYVVRGDDGKDLRTRTDAALLIFPDGVPCLQTSALLQKLPVDDDGLVHLARGTKAARSERAGLKVHRLPIAADELLELKGITVADGPRTFVDLAPRLSLEQLVAVGDVLLRRYDEDALRAAVDRRPGRPGLAVARRALPLLDAGADSPAETRARLRLHAAGFASMRHGVVIRDASGGWLAQPDLADEEGRVAIQHDGLVHVVGTPGQRRKDIQRDELSRQADWDVVVSTALDDVRPELLIEKVSAAYLRAARLRGVQVLPPHRR